MSTERTALWSAASRSSVLEKVTYHFILLRQNKLWSSNFLCGSLGWDHRKHSSVSCERMLTIPWLSLWKAWFSLESQAKCFSFFFCRSALCYIFGCALCPKGVYVLVVLGMNKLSSSLGSSPMKGTMETWSFFEATWHSTNGVCQLVASSDLRTANSHLCEVCVYDTEIALFIHSLCIYV